MATEFETEPFDASPNPFRLEEPTHRPAAFLVWESSSAYCRKDVTVDNTAGLKPIVPGTVVVGAGNAFVGILYGRQVMPGVSEEKTVVFRGPAIVKNEKLVFPVVTDAADGPDAGSDNAAENAAVTAALEATLRAAIAAAGISIQ